MGFGTRAVLGLLAGLALGALVAAAGDPSLQRIVTIVEPIGVLWLKALQMTIVPLVVSMLITGIGSAAHAATTGRLAARTLLLFVLFLGAAGALGALLTPAVLAWFPPQSLAVAALRAGVGQATAAVPTLPPLREWITELIPTNPFKAAADTAMLQVVIFALLFGFAAARLAPDRRTAFLGFFAAVMDTMLVMIRWILALAPAGVFALALGIGSRSGAAAGGALAYYVVLMCALSLLVTVALYPTVTLASRVAPGRFLRAALPAQVVAISTQSSLASLPAMLSAAQTRLGVPAAVAGLTLPLAVSLFRITSPIVNLSIVLFVAHVYGVHPDAARMAAGVLVAVVTSFGVVGLPSQITFFTTTVPISLVLGVPLPMLGLLLAVEVVPDIFRTLGNVTADLAVTVIAAHRDGASALGVRQAPIAIQRHEPDSHPDDVEHG